MSLRDAVNRWVGRSVVDLAQEVDAALGRLAQARGLEAEAQDALRLAQQDVARAQEEVRAARDALFREHPELAPDRVIQIPRPPDGPIPALNGVLMPGEIDQSKFEPVEVDDPDDPHFTAGAATYISPVDGDDLPPIEWTEHDG